MYAQHVPIIAEAMRRDARTFKRGVYFAILSARTQFVTVPEQLAQLDSDGREARCLFAWKLDAYEYVEANYRDLHAAVCATNDTAEALAILCTVPGLGIVKAAFVLQFLGFNIACLDVRNIVREGRNPREYETRGEKSGRKRGPAFQRMIQRYVDDVGGKAEHYWDIWCTDVAEVYGMTPDECSAIHLEIVPRKDRRASLARASLVPAANDIPF